MIGTQAHVRQHHTSPEEYHQQIAKENHQQTLRSPAAREFCRRRLLLSSSLSLYILAASPSVYTHAAAFTLSVALSFYQSIDEHCVGVRREYRS